MGFGILFIGYFLALPTFAAFYFTLAPAAALLAWACFKLARVNRPFGSAFWTACVLVPFAITASVLRLIPATEWLAPYFESACLIIWLVWHFLVLTGIEWVATETQLPKLRAAAFRNKLFACIYLLPAIGLTFIEVVAKMIPEAGRPILGGFNIAIVVIGLVVMALNLICFYTAYMRICMPADVDMPQKPSRFAFVNRRREAAAKKEAENAAALAELRAKRDERIAKRKAEKTAAATNDQTQKQHKKRKK